VTVDGGRDILGLWAGDGGEGAKWWLRVLTEIRNRGAGDACMVVCDGLKGLPDAIGEVWPAAVVQTSRLYALTGTLARAEPKTLRYRLLHTPARLVHARRYRWLRLPRAWPRASPLATAIDTIRRMPMPAT
jgi:transposase-like protein